ncbi:polysaccharide deacetylase family protein [Sulfitobacter sp. F26204]|uniref:polysaccharide deacetylase family protein n=1 Tax=Sulfitobacter sp. F26204 TaxID=2996014 RepID=UPI00225DF3E5|nr:polysaccharide deacetylase family protein [Sulfitobacter sp. F26204]MCX7560427.1 polysaccharide deacetylase family protein [Sulfitobacter sp. F26204]
MFDWSGIKQELAIWRRENRRLTVWWRDDDTVTHRPELDQLIDLKTKSGVALHIAVIPKHADQSLVAICRTEHNLVPLVHGWAHDNHASDGQKKAEFGFDRATLAADAERGIDRMGRLFGSDFLPCFVPPWNRILPDLLPALPDMGYTCVSKFTPRQQRLAAPGLVSINTHVDPINWRAGGGLLAPDSLADVILSLLRDRRLGRSDSTEPLGLLTHHLVHDAAIWTFTETFLKTMLDAGAMPVNLLELKDDLP